MKHKYIKALIATLGFIIVGWLSFMRPDWLILMGILMGACSYVLFSLVFTSIGSLRLGDTTSKISLGKWFAKLCLGQCSLLIMTLAAAVAFFAAGPNYSLSTVELSDLHQVLSDYSPWQWGPFPWGVIAIWGLGVAYVTYAKEGQPYLYQLGERIFSKKFEPVFKTYIESTTAGATMLLLSLMISVLVLLFTYIVDFHFQVFHFAMPIIAVILLSFLGPLSSLSIGRKIFRKLAGGRNATLNRIILLMTVLTVPVMIGAAFAGIYLLKHRPDMQLALMCKECGNYFANVPVESRLASLYWGWWLLWIPLAGSYVAKISKGRTIREFILGLYAIPILLVIIWAFLAHYPIKAVSIQLRPDSIPLLVGGLAVITMVVMLFTFKGIKDTSILLSGFMKPSTEKANRLWLKDASKEVGINLFSPKLLMSVLGTLFLHTTAGWFGIQLQVAAMGALVLNAVYMGFNLGAYQLFHNRRKYTVT